MAGKYAIWDQKFQNFLGGREDLGGPPNPPGIMDLKVIHCHMPKTVFAQKKGIFFRMEEIPVQNLFYIPSQLTVDCQVCTFHTTKNESGKFCCALEQN